MADNTAILALIETALAGVTPSAGVVHRYRRWYPSDGAMYEACSVTGTDGQERIAFATIYRQRITGGVAFERREGDTVAMGREHSYVILLTRGLDDSEPTEVVLGEVYDAVASAFDTAAVREVFLTAGYAIDSIECTNISHVMYGEKILCVQYDTELTVRELS